MTFSKNFPRQIEGQNYPKWVEVALSKEEESEVEEKARNENLKLLKECLDDAEKIIEEKKMKSFQSDVIALGIALFEKRASHEIYWKENKAKAKLEKDSLE